MEIKDIMKQAHAHAVQNSFYNCDECGGIGKFERVCGYFDISEPCHICNGTGKTVKLNVYDDMQKELEEFSLAQRSEPGIFDKDSEESEIADMILILLSYCEEEQIDIVQAVNQKLEYNEVREDHV